MLGISISLNAISTHGTCTAVFVVVAAIIGGVLGSIQTLHEVSWLAWVGATSILTASKCYCLNNLSRKLIFIPQFSPLRSPWAFRIDQPLHRRLDLSTPTGMALDIQLSKLPSRPAPPSCSLGLVPLLSSRSPPR